MSQAGDRRAIKSDRFYRSSVIGFAPTLALKIGFLRRGVNIPRILGDEGWAPNVWRRRVRCGRNTLATEEEFGTGLFSSSEKSDFPLKWHVLVYSERYLFSVPSSENVEFEFFIYCL